MSENPPPFTKYSQNNFAKLKNLATTDDLNLDLDLLLGMVLIMRVLPLRWVRDLPKQYDIDKFKVYNLITSAKTQEYLTIKKDITEEKLLYLTPKGYKRASKLFAVGYNYKRWTKDAIRTGTIYQEHHYILFRFFLDYFSHSKTADTVYTDYDKKCLLEYVGKKDSIIKPDGMIRPNGDDYYNIICIEADTGSMSQTALYDKFLRYFLFARNNFGGEPIQKLKLYFSFKTEQRLESVFTVDLDKNKGNIFKYFKDYSLKFRLSKLKDYIPIEAVYNQLQSGKIEIYAGVYNGFLAGYKQVDFWGLVLLANPKWERVRLEG